RAADHAPNVAVHRRHHYAKHQRGNGQRPAHDVADHIHDLLRLGVGRQGAILQLFPLQAYFFTPLAPSAPPEARILVSKSKDKFSRLRLRLNASSTSRSSSAE